jgi:hypothetical protein
MPIFELELIAELAVRQIQTGGSFVSNNNSDAAVIALSSSIDIAMMIRHEAADQPARAAQDAPRV